MDEYTLHAVKPFYIVIILGFVGVGVISAYSVGSSLQAVQHTVEIGYETTQAETAPLTTISNASSKQASAFANMYTASSTSITSIVQNITSSYQTSPSYTASAVSANSTVSYTSYTPGIHTTVSISSPSISTITGTQMSTQIRDVITTTQVSKSSSTIIGTHAPIEIRDITTSTQVSSSSSTIIGTVSLKPEQNRIQDDVLTVVYDHHQEHNELIVESVDTLLSRIVVTEETEDPKLNLESLVDETSNVNQNTTLTYPNTLDIDVVFNNITATISFTSETKMTGPVWWDGVINLPVFTETMNVTVHDDNTVTSVLTVGLDENIIEFNKPVSIIFDGKAGQLVGYMRGETQTMIGTLCEANDPVTVSGQLNGSGECKIDSGADLVVWTYHFTEFFTISTPVLNPIITTPLTIIPSGPPAIIEDLPISGENSGGGGGNNGGGGSSRGGGGGILVGTNPNTGLSVELDFESNGTPTNPPLRMEPGDTLTIRPRIMSEDYDTNIYKMDVSFNNGTVLPSTWIQYSVIPIASACDGTVIESYRIYACDNASILSLTGLSYTERQGVVTTLFDNLKVQFDDTFSGHMEVDLIDTRGIILHSGTYAIDVTRPQIDEQTSTEQVVEQIDMESIPVEPTTETVLVPALASDIIHDPEPIIITNSTLIEEMMPDPEPTPVPNLLDCGAGIEPVNGTCKSIPEQNNIIDMIKEWFESLFGVFF